MYFKPNFPKCQFLFKSLKQDNDRFDKEMWENLMFSCSIGLERRARKRKDKTMKLEKKI